MSTKIEWTDETWNVVTGCDRVSPGCDNCYIERTFPFRIEGRRFDEHGKMGVRLHPDRLDQPLRWRRPRRVFVNSLSDLFHPDVPDEFIGDAFDIMASCREHTFQVLTKRPQRMAALLSRWNADTYVRADGIIDLSGRPVCPDDPWPLPNVWLGVSVENQRYADLRIPHLLDTPAAVRFVSCEPLLGPVDLRPRPASDLCIRCGEGPDAAHDHPDGYRNRGLDWCIVGGESGPGARPMHPEWAWSLRDQCQVAGVPFFFKQWGEWRPWQQGDWQKPTAPSGLVRVGKKAAGRELDGRTWDEFPELVS